jgi:phage anti-repressor protein
MKQLNLPDFLKKYTAISEKFIGEYYKFYEICQTHYFGILVENVAKYLGITKIKKFLERIREKYEINKDYVIMRKKGKSAKGVQEAYYFISFDCFEKICMLSHAKKADEVRDYFIILRKFINYYKDHFADKINELVLDDNGMYIILVNKKKDIFKFGKTDKSFRARFKSYMTGKDKHPDIKFIMHVDDPKAVEKCTRLFTKVNKIRGNSELRKIDVNKLKEVIFNCAMLDKKFNEK